MTRKKMMDEIKDCLEKSEVPSEQHSKQAADIAVDCALDYVLRYTQSLAEELVLSGFHSEARTAGLVGLKIKGLMKN